MHTTLLLEMMADAAPDRLALGCGGEALSYGELHRRTLWAAELLMRSGGETVAFVGLNGPDLPLGLFAAGVLGRPFAPLNYRLPDVDLRKLLARTAPATAIVDDDMLPRLGAIDGVTLIPRTAFNQASCRPGRCETTFEGAPDIAVLLFTSGTTGEPKAAILRHANLVSYVISTVEFLSANDGEAALVSVPPYHIAGISALLTGVYCGRRIVHLEAFSAQDWVAVASREQISHAMVVPTMLSRILDVLTETGERLPALKALSYGGGRMPRPVIERALSLLPHVGFANAYGLTETSSTISVLGPEDHWAAIRSDEPKIRGRLASVGKAMPSLEVEIRGAQGEALAAGQHGEIHVRGAQVSGEYAHKKALNDDGWFATNDGGWMDEDGYLYVEGRLDDVIVRGGENISPGEVEDVLRAHPDVADVAVFGAHDDQWGETVAAAVVPRGSAPTTEELIAWVKARLRSTKTPEIWSFREALPYNETGKLLRRQLKADFTA